MGERVNLVLGADASQFRREFQNASREVEKLDKILNKGQKQGIFNKRDVKEYDQQLGRVQQSLRNQVGEYRRVSQEVKILRQEQEKIIASGGKLTAQQKQQLQTAQAGMRAAHHTVLSTQGQMNYVQSQRAGIGTQGRFGQFGAMAAARMAGLPGMAFSWAKAQSDAGTQLLIQNSMARMQSEQLTGVGKFRGYWNPARRRMEGYGRSLGYTTAESQQYYSMGSRASGYSDAQGARSNMAMMRAYSMDPGQLFGYHGALRQSGGFGSNQNAMAVNQALIKGLQLGGFGRVLSGEMTQALTGLITQHGDAQERVSGAGMAGLVGLTSRRLGGAFARSPARTGRLLSNLSQSIQSPGGGDAGKAFMLRAMGFGSGTSYVDALEMMQKGLSDPKNMQRVLSRLKGEVMGGEKMQALALSELTGGKIKIWQGKRLLRLKEGEFTKEGVNKAMAAETTDITGQAGATRSKTGLLRRQIGRAEAQANLRGKADPAYKLGNDAYLAAMKTLTSAIESLAALFKGDMKKAGAGAEGVLKYTNLPMILYNMIRKPTQGKSGRNPQ